MRSYLIANNHQYSHNKLRSWIYHLFKHAIFKSLHELCLHFQKPAPHRFLQAPAIIIKRHPSKGANHNIICLISLVKPRINVKNTPLRLASPIQTNQPSQIMARDTDCPPGCRHRFVFHPESVTFASDIPLLWGKKSGVSLAHTWWPYCCCQPARL